VPLVAPTQDPAPPEARTAHAVDARHATSAAEGDVAQNAAHPLESRLQAADLAVQALVQESAAPVPDPAVDPPSGVGEDDDEQAATRTTNGAATIRDVQRK